MIVDYIKNTIENINTRIERTFSGKFGRLKLLIGSVLLSLFFAFPSYDVLMKGEFDDTWNAIQAQTQEPFTKKDYPLSSHASSITLRLVPPLLGKLLGLNRLEYLFLQTFFLGLMFYFIIELIRDISQDIVSTIYLSVGLAFIFLGNVLVSDIRGIFDVIAYTFLAISMKQKHPLLILILILLASFTDERAFLASSIVAIYFIVRDTQFNQITLSTFLRGKPSSWAVVISWIIFFSTRFLLKKTMELETTVSDAGISLAIAQINAFAFGLWTGLEGFWLLVLVAGLIVVVEKRFTLFFLAFATAGLVCIGAMCVIDITRSMAYVFPIAILALAIIEKTENRNTLRYLSFITMMICFLPTYYIGGKNTVQMFYPFPFQIIRILHSSP